MTQARELAENESDADNVDRSECVGYVNASLGQWHGIVAKAVPERFEAEQTITADGSASYALPSNYYQTIGVDFELSDDVWAPLARVMPGERNMLSGTGDAIGYRIKAATVVLMPKPSSGTYRHLYVTAAPVLSADGDTFDGVNGWEQWVVYDVAWKILVKEGSTEEADRMARERDRIQAEIEAAAADRETANPMRVVDVRSRLDYDPDFWV